MRNFIEFLEKNSIEFSTDVSAKTLTSFRVGGNVRVVVKPRGVEEIKKVFFYLIDNEIDYVLLGKGSNVVFSDEGFDGAVVLLSELSNVEIAKFDENYIVAGAGVSMFNLANFAYQNGLAGLEFAQGIPGSVGGGVYMNAGAYGGEISAILDSCLVLDIQTGRLLVLDGEDCEFSYRHSIFVDNKNLVVLYATFALEFGDSAEIKAKMDDFRARRVSTQPLEYPSAGSTFKRPKDHFAGKLIEDAGLKGYRVGGACVSEKHAGFIVNVDNATSNDIKELVEHIKKTVDEKFGVMLECEIIFIE